MTTKCYLTRIISVAIDKHRTLPFLFWPELPWVFTEALCFNLPFLQTCQLLCCEDLYSNGQILVAMWSTQPNRKLIWGYHRLIIFIQKVKHMIIVTMANTLLYYRYLL